MPSRRQFLACTAGLAAAPLVAARAATDRPILKPPRLRPGHTVGIVSPAGVTTSPESLERAEAVLAELGLATRRAPNVLARRGYFAGPDQMRADDFNRMMADPAIDAVLTLRGGWGAARMLPYVDYDQIRLTPKILLGYSDITALLVAVYARSGVVTFHGPNGGSTWSDFSREHLRPLLFDAATPTLQNPLDLFADAPEGKAEGGRRRADGITTLTPGRARGRLVGGNLTVLSALLGSGYLPNWGGHILFLEDVNEAVYRVDRMLTHLRIAGVLNQLAGFVFGQCTRCEDDDEDYDGPGLTLEEVLRDHLEPLGIPAFHGALFGHVGRKLTLPLGVPAEIDAGAGTIRLLEAAVR